MKTIVLIALTGFMGLNCMAQNKDCSCHRKTAYHHHTVHKRNINTTNGTAFNTGNNASCTTTASTTANQQQVRECPPYFATNNGCIYDSSGEVKYIMEQSFTGNYPVSIDVNETMPARQLTVTSSAFKNYGVMPSKYTCEGEQASPPLKIDNIPSQTQSLAVVMYDPDANEKGSETYWLIWDIDTSSGMIPENFVNNHESLNVAHEYGYHAVCPLSGTHYYHFMVYALDTKLKGNKQTTRAKLESAMRGHVLAKGELVGLYERL